MVCLGDNLIPVTWLSGEIYAMEFYHPNFLFSAGQDGFLRMWALPCISTIKDCAVSRPSFTTSTWTGRIVQDDGEGTTG